jgi:hypothetical protein
MTGRPDTGGSVVVDVAAVVDVAVVVDVAASVELSTAMTRFCWAWTAPPKLALSSTTFCPTSPPLGLPVMVAVPSWWLWSLRPLGRSEARRRSTGDTDVSHVATSKLKGSPTTAEAVDSPEKVETQSGTSSTPAETPVEAAAGDIHVATPSATQTSAAPTDVTALRR